MKSIYCWDFGHIKIIKIKDAPASNGEVSGVYRCTQDRISLQQEDIFRCQFDGEDSSIHTRVIRASREGQSTSRAISAALQSQELRVKGGDVDHFGEGQGEAVCIGVKSNRDYFWKTCVQEDAISHLSTDGDDRVTSWVS